MLSRTLLLLSLVSSLCFGQLNGIISGTVSDPSMSVVPNASETVTNAETGVVAWRGRTNESGLYRAPNLGPARYNIEVEAQGYKHATVNGVTLALDQRSDISVTLETGAVAE